MKKARKLGLQSLALVLMAFVLVAGVAFGMTGAWFTDTKNDSIDDITLANNVYIDRSKATMTPTYDGTRLDSSAVTASTLLPGDTITLDFKIAKGTYDTNKASVDFAAKMSITVEVWDSQYATYAAAETAHAITTLTANGAGAASVSNPITYTQKTRKGAAAYAAYSNDTVFFVGTDTDVQIVLTLNGAYFQNSWAGDHIKVTVVTKAIQAGNYETGNWEDHGIVEYTTDWTA